MLGREERPPFTLPAVVTDVAARSRPLGRMEAALTLSDEHWPLNMVAVLKLAAVPDAEMLRASFEQVQRRHPALRTRIERRGRRYAFAYDGVAAIPLRVVEGAEPDSWIEVVEDALNTNLPAAIGPLASATLLPSGEGASAELVLTFHHSIIDAVSGTNLLREVLAAYGALGEGDPPPWAVPLDVAPAADNLFPPGYRGAWLRARRVGFACRTMGSETRYRLAMRRAGPPPVRPNARTRVLPALLDADVTTQLGRVARRRRLTFSSVLHAAVLAAVHRHRYDARPVLLRTLSFSDLRPYLAPPMPVEPLACYTAMTWQDVPMGEHSDMWALARDVQQRVDAATRGGAKFVASSMSLPLMRMALAAKRLRMGNTALSHTGVAQLRERHGPLEVRGLHAFISNLGLGPEFSLRTGIFGGRLTLDAAALDTDMERDEMRRIAADVAAILEAAAS